MTLGIGVIAAGVLRVEVFCLELGDAAFDVRRNVSRRRLTGGLDLGSGFAEVDGVDGPLSPERRKEF